MVGGYGVGYHHLCADILYYRRLQVEAIGGLAAHVEAFQAPGVVSVRDTLLDCLPFKLGEYDTDIQHGPAHRGRGVELLCGGNKLHIVFLKQLHHVRKVQNGAAYSVQLIDNYPAYLAFAYLAKELLKFGPVGILAGITLVFENPATAAFQLILAEINLALNADTVLAVYGLSCINYIFSDIHVGLLSCGMELPTYKYIIPLIAPQDNVVDGQAGLSPDLLYLLNTSYRQRSMSFFRFSFSFGESTGVRLSSTMLLP